jgi:hypothetical protein
VRATPPPGVRGTDRPLTATPSARPMTADRATTWLSPLSLGLTACVALLAAAASAAALFGDGRVYEQETVMLSDAAIAQDIVTLLVVAPLLVVLGLRARRGSLSAFVCLVGCLAFTAYNYVIYAFSIHFGPLFLVWVATLGLSIFALASSLAAADMSAIKQRFAGRAMRVPAWFLIVVAALFAMLWLSEIVPDLLAGAPSRSATDWNVPTNPVHVLDLAFFLPGVIASGILLLHRHPLGYATVAGQLVCLGLTSVPILVTTLVANARGHDAAWAVTFPISALLLASLTILGRVLQHAAYRPAASEGQTQ